MADAVVVGAAPAAVQAVAGARLQDVPILIIILITHHHHHHHHDHGHHHDHLVALVEEVGGAGLAVAGLVLDT